jgi:hypothetical protein
MIKFSDGQLMSTYDVSVGTISKTIDTANFTEGVYFLTLQSKDRVQSRKFVKE